MKTKSITILVICLTVISLMSFKNESKNSESTKPNPKDIIEKINVLIEKHITNKHRYLHFSSQMLGFQPCPDGRTLCS